jgi:hypothetical protein
MCSALLVQRQLEIGLTYGAKYEDNGNTNEDIQ